MVVWPIVHRPRRVLHRVMKNNTRGKAFAVECHYPKCFLISLRLHSLHSMKPFHCADLYESCWNAFHPELNNTEWAARGLLHLGLSDMSTKIKTEVSNKDISSRDIGCIFKSSYTQRILMALCAVPLPAPSLTLSVTSSKHQSINCCIVLYV